jgi:hypothetical protein
MAVVTFGGAYAVLAYVAQQAVEHYGWLKPGEMLDGLGMAETTPGPLIMVLQFVGFMAAYRDPGALSPMLAGTLGGLLATWVTFTPCFLWIFLGAPFIETMRGDHRCRGRRRAQPRHLVRDPHGVSRDRAGACVSAFVRGAAIGERGLARTGIVARGRHRNLPIQDRDDPGARFVLRRGNRAVPVGSAFVNVAAAHARLRRFATV